MDTGWIILTLVLTGIIILLLLLWVFGTSVPQQCSFGAPWGVIPDTSGPSLMTCGSSHNQICTFPVSSLSGAINQCDQLQCSQFMYNELLQQMTIVDPNGPRTSTPQTDLFIRNSPIASMIPQDAFSNTSKKSNRPQRYY
jgi:hypothetical protein